MTDSLPVLEGTLVLGRYRVVKPLARGGMGVVYLGRIEGAAGFAKPVVIKRVLSQVEGGAASREQFIREARILSSLQHPNIVGVLDFAQEGDSYLMILEYVHGYHLGHWLRYVRTDRTRVAYEHAVYITLKVLAALHYAHTNLGPDGKTREIIHRDVSPGNILLDLEANVRLLDFGIAVDKDEGREFQTQDGIVKGKLPYIAPEMYRSTEASVSSDVYAVGVVLYQLLSGSNPFSDKDMSSIVRRVLEVVPPPISSVRNDVPAGLDRVLAKAIAKDPAERHTDALEFAKELQAILERSEAEIAEDLRSTIRVDFTGDMPNLLSLENLTDLDAAWRSAIGIAAPSLLRSSLPPGALKQETRPLERPPSAEEQLSDETIIEPHLLRGQQRTTSSRGISSKALVIGMLGAGVLAAAVAVGAVLLTAPQAPAPKEPRFLVVERQGGAAAAPAAPEAKPGAAVATASPVVPTAQAAEPPAPPPSPSPGVSARPAGGGANALTAAFARRQGAVQSCFTKHAEALQGSPKISIRFELSGPGPANKVTLQPAALSGTALGQCLLGVARTTQFQDQQGPVAFSIPITTQSVPK